MLGCDTANGKVSGGVLHNFTEGWALQKFTIGKAHYFKTNRNSYVYAICGANVQANANHGDLLAKGNFDACKTCLRIAKLQNLTLPIQPPAIESSSRNVV